MWPAHCQMAEDRPGRRLWLVGVRGICHTRGGPGDCQEQPSLVPPPIRSDGESRVGMASATGYPGRVRHVGKCHEISEMMRKDVMARQLAVPWRNKEGRC